MTETSDHRSGYVTMACICGAVLDLPPGAAKAARPAWDHLHSGHGHGPASVEQARAARASGSFEGFIAAAERAAKHRG